MNLNTASEPNYQPSDETLEELICAKVLCAVGDIEQAEREVIKVLDSQLGNLDGLNLFAKIKHIKGELSQAIACWAQLHVQAPHNETARMFLISIMHLAQNPERNAGEFVAMGQFGAKLSPTVLMELEKSFRFFLGRRHTQAQSVCDNLAIRFKGKNSKAYKLAILAKAWISELIGDFKSACETLERLGGDAGMETDIDRVLALARVYEQIGNAESLSKAAHICRYLIRSYAKMSALIRLAAIHRRLGKDQEANIFEEQFYQYFCQRMFVPSRPELAFAASKMYIPLAKLCQAQFAEGDRPVALSQRGEAIAAYLSGESRIAQDFFIEHHEQPIDLQYRLELLIEAGEAEPAFSLADRMWTGEQLEPGLLLWYLKYGKESQPRRIAKKIDNNNCYQSGKTFLEGLLTQDSRNFQAWQCLHLLHEMQDHAEEARKCQARAQAFIVAKNKEKHCVGRALAAAVYNFTGKKKGIIHELWAERTNVDAGTGGHLPESQILGNLTIESRNSIRNIFAAVKEYAQAKFPHLTQDLYDYSYMFKVTKEDEASGGQSIGLPTALAFLSVLIQKPIDQAIASSGIIISESHKVLTVRKIGDTSYKVKATFNRNLKGLVLPSENKSELQQLTEVPRQVCEQIVHYAMDLDEAVGIAFGKDIWLA